jgi:cytochrome c-type protein NapB
MKTQIATLTLFVAACAVCAGAFGVESLRGDQSLTDPSAKPDRYKVEVVAGGFDRSFREQPPMIPHGIEKYTIDLRQNGCLKCHSEATAASENTKPAPQSHFLDRDGNQLERISSRRYFCTQCHTVQLQGAPLVDNTFEGRR